MSLALTRRPGQSIIVDGAATITVVWVRENRVRFSIDAPLTTKILRNEHLQTERPDGDCGGEG